jgi:hypothetical protein
VPAKVVFQKNYRVAEPMFERTPKGLAEAMSRAMERASAEITTDVYQAARQRLVTEKQQMKGRPGSGESPAGRR